MMGFFILQNKSMSASSAIASIVYSILQKPYLISWLCLMIFLCLYGAVTLDQSNLLTRITSINVTQAVQPSTW